MTHRNDSSGPIANNRLSTMIGIACRYSVGTLHPHVADKLMYRLWCPCEGYNV